MPRMEIEGAQLEYFESGGGEPLVLVHGSASDCRTWQAQRAPFAARFRTIAYSRRYHGPNQTVPEGVDYVMSRHVEDLRQLLRRLEAAPAHLVGHSYGAFLCLLLAIEEPRLVRSLVLAEPPAVTLFIGQPAKLTRLLSLLVTRPRTTAAIIRFVARGLLPARRAFHQGNAEQAIRTFAQAVFGRGGYDRLSASRKAQVWDNVSNIRAEVIGPGFAPLEREQVRGVDVPTLLVSGENSITLFHCLVEYLQELLPHAETVTIPEASHMMHEDNPTAYNAAVLAFLEKVRKQAWRSIGSTTWSSP